jgi:FtsP/CotA-like multicopper oxidase with cupredoxin domain
MGKKSNSIKSQPEDKLLSKKSPNLCDGDKSQTSTVDNDTIKIADKELKRRDFLKLSVVIAGGAIATIALESYLHPLSLIPTASGQLINGSKKGNVEKLDVHSTTLSAPSILSSLSIPMFENQLSGPPPVYDPKVITNNGKVIRHEYTVAMTTFTEQILPPSMNLLTSVWGYGGAANDAITGDHLGFVQGSPGPTFEAVRGIPIQVEWQNNISSPYMFAVDPTIHWSNPNNSSEVNSPFSPYPPGYSNAQKTVPLVTHLHGGENQSFYDGGPNAWFTSDGRHGPQYSTYRKTDSNKAIYYYPNGQQATTLWYHDHGLGVTRLNVMSGLAGFYLIREQQTGADKVASMLPNGKYEMPLAIQDRTFNTDGSFYYPSAGIEPTFHPYWVNSFLGSTIMVNGKVWPNMNVEKGQYRLRLLNGSNSRFYNLQFSNGMSFVQIGSDGGYLKAPVTVTSLFLAPAERADIIVDFSNLAPNEKVILQNTALTSNSAEEKQTVGQIMQFTTTDQMGITPFNITEAPNPFNPTLAAASFPTLEKGSKDRILTLFEVMGQNNTKMALLDGQMWDAPISEQPEQGTTEDWIIVNPTMNSHPIHLHLVQFQLVQRETFDTATYVEAWKALNGGPPFSKPTRNVNLTSFLSNLKVPIQPNEQGWKDTITVNAAEVVTIRVRFAQQDGSNYPFDATAGSGYVWHCHLLEHEDNEMMRPYVVTKKASIILPLTVSLAVVSAAALLLGYSYYRKKRKKPQINAESINRDYFGQKTEEAENENGNY